MISIGNERRSGGTRGTTYWITPVRHEAADAESAPMPLAMPCLVPLPRHGGGSVARHEHWATICSETTRYHSITPKGKFIASEVSRGTALCNQPCSQSSVSSDSAIASRCAILQNWDFLSVLSFNFDRTKNMPSREANERSNENQSAPQLVQADPLDEAGSDICFECGKPGHRVRDCPQPGPQGQSNHPSAQFGRPTQQGATTSTASRQYPIRLYELQSR
ncbi:hypothetical protein FXO38_24782 [Capsicum annuum]|nr:hypothetical protein FXO38_24782 [Capsicum annuum]